MVSLIRGRRSTSQDVQPKFNNGSYVEQRESGKSRIKALDNPGRDDRMSKDSKMSARQDERAAATNFSGRTQPDGGLIER